ncbi:pptc7 [Acrasis kona]|uniref:Protein phosphatase n=1 Tax=Acrasis kona TaxID=1008807 RepID=A0AAW2Z8S6_9EUKA
MMSTTGERKLWSPITPTRVIFPQGALFHIARTMFASTFNLNNNILLKEGSFFQSIFSWWPFGRKINQQQEEQKKNTGSNISFTAAGYCIGKNVKAVPPINTVQEVTNKSYDCGEDAFFVDNKSGSFGVADGVGSWSKRGVDPGEIARKLMSNSQEAISAGQRDPYAALDQAYKTIVQNKQVRAGSSTACLLTIKNDKLLTANVGDSGFIVLRPPTKSGQEYEVIYKSPEQQLHFNCPKQLSIIPPELAEKRNFIQTNPSEADKGQFSVLDGDIVVAGTDGLFDNLYQHEIADEVTKASNELKANNPQYEVEVAKRLVLRAKRVTRDKSVTRTPFADSASKNGMYHMGGKVDDITCVVARISNKQ